MIRAAFAIALMMAALLAACDGDEHQPSQDDSSDSTERLSLQAREFQFEPDELTVRTGATTSISLENTATIEHDFQIDEIDVEVLGGGAEGYGHGAEHGGDGGVAVHTEAGESESITFIAHEPGTYEFYCTIAGHKEAGMVGRMIVE